MNGFTRFFPAIFAAVALLGCLLPFADKGNLLSLPDAMAQAGGLIGMVGMGTRSQGGNAASLTLAVWVARLVYVVPIMAVWVIVQNFRGNVGKPLQLTAAATWIIVPILVPYLTGKALLQSLPFLRDMAKAFGNQATSFSLNLGIGGWVLVLSAIGMVLSAQGLLKNRQQS